ncbi:cytochrome c biogenesis protein CcsA [Novispirillum sp. DQ9]|uniref:cytochrome c biogenesis protein CcsA n=1 Tax=Novispirillum sp. DQ9 TaxID=3398612 RepID=UPI003C7C3F9C
MLSGLLHSVTALLTMLPAAILGLRPDMRRDAAFWAALGLAFVGPAVLAGTIVAGHWVTGLAPALWVSIAATILLFGIGAAVVPTLWRLLPLLAPYLLLLGLIATVWQHTLGAPLPAEAPTGWVRIHITVGVLTYALLTLAAVAALAAFLQERALKRKRPTRLTRQLPSVADAERASTLLLALSEVVLGLGLVSGMAVEWLETQRLMAIDHKTLLSIAVFVLIGALLAAKHFTGVRGRGAARFVLLAYLLLTLAYPGVKFVTNVLVG